MEVVIEPSMAASAIDPREAAKLLQAIQVHGYRGPSKKRHNGVVPIRPTDARMIKTLRRRLSERPDLAAGLPVKVVAHVPTGNRLIGVLLDGRVHLLGVERY